MLDRHPGTERPRRPRRGHALQHTRPRYFAQIIGELIYWIGEDRIQFSSDYALWTPRWLIERLVDFQIPEDMTEYAPLTVDQKKKILGLNAAKMHGIPVPAELQLPDAGETVTGVKIDDSLEPADVAALADAGLTDYHAAAKAAKRLTPRDNCVVIGAGGLGHIGIQVLKARMPPWTTVVGEAGATPVRPPRPHQAHLIAAGSRLLGDVFRQQLRVASLNLPLMSTHR